MNEEQLALRMKSDWDRRISHDYRFWMSDGYQSDEAMWSSGARDFDIITEGISSPKEKSIVEIGCGVGRLLKSASEKFGKVYGVDISDVALERAQALLQGVTNVDFIHGDGYTLKELENDSTDVVFSFAAITSTPVQIFSRYILEANRILKPGGVFRLQMYLGKEQQVAGDDTLHLRCYRQDNFREAIEMAGFEIEWIEELKLPFQVSFEEAGIIAKVGSFRKVRNAETTSEQVALRLLPDGEPQHADSVTGIEVECWMSLNYARELAESGDLDRAKQTLDFAVTHAKSINLDIQDLLQRIVSLIESKESAVISSSARTSPGTVQSDSSVDFTTTNIAELERRFPSVATGLRKWEVLPHEVHAVERKETPEGLALLYDRQALDHPTAPVRGAESWVRSQLNVDEARKAKEILVYGFGGGYHLEALLRELSECAVSVVEPSWECFRAALALRDLRGVLSQLKRLVVGDVDEVSNFTDGTYIMVRPQNASLFPHQLQKLRSQFYGEHGLSLIHPTVTVLGPIQGGTLPILGYSVHALAGLQQRVRSIDMSCFSGGFSGVESLVHDEVRQALLRGKFTETLSDMVLEAANEKPMDILLCMAQAPISGRALQELRSRGVITVLWFVEDYLRFPVWKYMAQYYDFIFTIQRGECLDAIKAAGAGEVHYLPTAADPLIHTPLKLSPEERNRWGSPISFVGAGYHNRQQLFASLSGMPFKIWGTEWPECKPFDRMVQEGGRRLKPEEYVKIFNATDININLHSSTERDGVDPAGDFLNPRTFELAACGAFQLVDKRSLLNEAFIPGEEIEVFESRSELVEKIEYYLAHPEARLPFIEKARARVLREHTYQHRIKQMLSIIYASRFDQLKRRIGTSPWVRVIERAEKFPELRERCEVAYRRGEEANLDGLVADIVTGHGKLSETEQKLLFLFHIRKQMIRMRHEERVKS